MRKIVLGILSILLTISLNAQIKNPVKWDFTAKKIADKTYEISLAASIEGNWHMYAQDPGQGPAEPTKISFSANPLLIFDGNTREIGKLEKAYDKTLNSVLKYYEKKVIFLQKVKIKSSVTTVVKGSVFFMVCNDKLCLPPREVPFSINISGK